MIDQISQRIIKLALYLDKKQPGMVSEIWIEEETKKNLEKDLPTDEQIADLISMVRDEVKSIEDTIRNSYLSSILDSLDFQINNLDSEISYGDFTENAFGYRIERVSESEIQKIEDELQKLESRLGVSRQEVFERHALPKEEYQVEFKKYVAQAKKILPKYISDFPDGGFEFEVVTDKPWSAFNSHIAPFRSRLTINSDISFSRLDLYRLAFHEAYGGHHSELSHKDRLLVDKKKGEHGIIITFSPQTFVSEAIAEGAYVLLGGLDKSNDEQLVGWYYDRLVFVLHNLATHLFFDDGLDREEINKRLKKYGITNKSRENVLNFSLDPLFGKYAPVYYTAFNFLSELYEHTDQKDRLIETIFTQPCTPKLLTSQYRTLDVA